VSGAAISVTEASSTLLDDVAVNAGTLSVNSGGAISQVGGKTVTAGGLASFKSSGSGANGNITLNNSGNNFGSIALGSLSGAAVLVTEASSTFLDDVAVNAGTLSVNSAGAIGQVGGKTVTAGGLASFTTSGSGAAGNIALDNAGNNFGSIGLSSASGAAVSVTEASSTLLDDVKSGGTLGVTSGGDIGQVGGKTVIAGSTAAFTAPGGNSILLGNAGNTFGGPVFFSGNGGPLQNVTIRDSELDSQNHGTIFDITDISVIDTLSVNSSGGVTQSGNIVADKLQITAAGAVTLDVLQGTLVPANNQVNTIAGKVTGTGNSFSFRDLATLNIGTAGGVSGITTDNGNVALTADNMNILAAINTANGNDVPPFPTGDVLLQQITSGRNILLGGKDVNALSFTQPELENIKTRQLQVGNTDAGAVTGFNSVQKPTSIKDFIAVGNKTTISIASGQIAGLSAVTIPAPRLDTSTLSGGEVTGDDAAKLLPAGAIGTLWLQLRFPPVPEERYRIEDISKFTGGRVAAAGATAGPQTAK
jgi:hypothetical protein